jgi:hypothetical protein
VVVPEGAERLHAASALSISTSAPSARPNVREALAPFSMASSLTNLATPAQPR